MHANQLSYGPGVQLAVELEAASADHCTHLTDADVDALVQAADTTVATLLPGAEFSTRAQWPDARRLIDAGATVALSTDCNPGSSYTSSMPFCIALAVRDMRMTPDEALWAATAGGARALRRTDIGRIAPEPAPTWPSWRPRATSTWPTGPVSRSSPPSGSEVSAPPERPPIRPDMA